MTWNKWKLINLILVLFIYAPISFYISFWILRQLHPDRLIWFLWIIQVPLYVILQIITKLAEDD